MIIFRNAGEGYGGKSASVADLVFAVKTGRPVFLVYTDYFAGLKVGNCVGETEEEMERYFLQYNQGLAHDGPVTVKRIPKKILRKISSWKEVYNTWESPHWERLQNQESYFVRLLERAKIL